MERRRIINIYESCQKVQGREGSSRPPAQHVRRVACHDLYAAIQTNISYRYVYIYIYVYLLSSKTHLKCQHMRHINIAHNMYNSLCLSLSPSLSALTCIQLYPCGKTNMKHF